ncbi:MAG: HAMP domain-containing histidine kinase, partial [Myxococcales bacterium]|nr:HAMP domain-containing histidine kinase [Myxococcales bacterium]
TGLGLAIVKKIVVEHHGAIAVTPSARLGGAAFVVTLPLAPAASAVPSEGPIVGGAPLSTRAIPARR